jgi:serine/threonine protein kinase
MLTEKKRLKYDELGNDNYLKVPNTPMKRSQSDEEKSQQDRYNAEIADRFTKKISLTETKNSSIFRVTVVNNQTCALKELNPLLLSKKKILQKSTLLEYSHAKSLQGHPNILRYDSFIQFGPYISFLMEYLPGGTLEMYLRNNRLFPDPVSGVENEILWYFFVDLLNGLCYVHFMNMVHLDIKPSNILLAPRQGKDIPILKIGDFGLSRIIGNTSKEENINIKKGDGKYLAPELLSSSSIITSVADIFSLGICIYEMATHVEPSDILWQNITSASPGLFDTLSSDLRPILSRMLSVDPSVRISARECLENYPRLRTLFNTLNYTLPNHPLLPSPMSPVGGSIPERVSDHSHVGEKVSLMGVKKKLF